MGRACLVLLLLAPTALADRVILKTGGTLSGVIVERNARGIVIEVGPGRIGLPFDRIERIETGTSALAEYRAQAAAIDAADAAAWAQLGLWARDRGLETQAQAAFARALEADPGNALAHRAVGHVLQGGAWLTREESYRAQGLVPFDGRWITPAERDAALQERMASAAADAARREAEVRAREAEARAEAAEAAARQAEAARTETTAGIPYWWAISGSGCTIPGCYGYRPPHVRPSAPYRPHRPSAPEPAPSSRPPARDMGRPQRTERN